MAALADPTASVSRAVKLLVALIGLVVGFGMVSRDLAFAVPFYEAVAQVIPLFLLVAVVEGGFFRDRPRTSDFDQRVRRTLLLLVLAGEAIALTVIARGDDTMMLRGAVITALIFAASLFIAYAFDGPAHRHPPDS
jgi:hypothetical protein